MPLYMTQFAYTPEAWSALVKEPENRATVLREVLQQVGGRLVALYYAVTGEYDGVVLFEAPDASTATTYLIATLAPGHLRATNTTVLITAEDAMGAMRDAGTLTFRAPGRRMPPEEV